MTRKEFLVFGGIGLVSLFGIGGAVREFLLHAATPTASFEPENGTLANGATAVTDSTASGNKAVKFAQPTTMPGTFGPLVGCYISGDTAATDIVATFGHQQETMTWYQQTNNQNFSTTQVKSMIDKGTCPVITITAKSSDASVPYLRDIANGSGAGWTWMQTYVSNLKTVADYAVSKGLKCYGTIEHEFEVKQNQGQIDGSITNAQFAKALSNFIAYTRANAPNVTTLYWFGISDSAAINEIAGDLTVKPDMYSCDPYASKGSTSTFDTVASRAKSFITGASWYKGEPYAISETGQSSGNDSSLAAYYTNLHAKAKQYGFEFITVFDATGTGLTTAVTSSNKSSYPLTVAAFGASLGGQ